MLEPNLGGHISEKSGEDNAKMQKTRWELCLKQQPVNLLEQVLLQSLPSTRGRHTSTLPCTSWLPARDRDASFFFVIYTFICFTVQVRCLP